MQQILESPRTCPEFNLAQLYRLLTILQTNLLRVRRGLAKPASHSSTNVGIQHASLFSITQWDGAGADRFS
jgi:hypothetical protein